MTPARLVGVDVTSTPSTRKPLVAAFGTDDDGTIVVERIERWASFAPLEALLRDDATATVVGVDAPLGLPRTFVEATGWPDDWVRYVRRLAALDRAGWRALLRSFTDGRPAGEKYLRRDADLVAGAQSPLNAVRPPVALMLHELAPRVAASPADVPGLRRTSCPVQVVEVYPALAAASLLGAGRGGPGYKDDRRHHGRDREERRERLVRRLGRDAWPYAVDVVLPSSLRASLVAERTADQLDAVLCLLQAGWAARREDRGVPASIDPCEGWIADPATALDGG